MDQEKAKTATEEQTEIATLGGGCFWCTEAVFNALKGVERVAPGYSGGTATNPTYEQVSSGNTGHAEVVQITFNPRVISFKEVIEIFFATHDPTAINRQGPDVGTQYRSVIFYHSDQQKVTAEKEIKEITEERVWNKPIATKIEPFKVFYEAEDYHKNYFAKHPEQQYCQIVIAPKLAKLQKTYLSKLKIF